MYKVTSFIMSVLLFITLITGCEEDEQSKANGEFSTPTIVEPGKTDIIGDDVNQRGRISFGGEVFGDFVEDNQLDGWIFTASKGAVVTVDNSNTGTARQLDSTLFLYGPKDETGFYGNDPLSFDDDGGWGYHARIDEFEIPENGEYLVVMGTYMNIDRGNYRLTLTCDSGDCIIPCDDDCPYEDSCSGSICNDVDGCIDSQPELTCSNEKRFLISSTEIITAEGLETDSFTIKLGAAPDENIILWVNSSDNDEAAVFPQKLIFCVEGQEEGSNGCAPIEEGVVRDTPHWKREITVTITGMNDQLVDGDKEFTLDFLIVTFDEEYAELTPEPIPCTNIDADSFPDYSILDGLTEDELMDALYPFVAGQTAYGYQGQNSVRTVMFNTVDLHDGKIESIYNGSTITMPRDSSQAYRNGFNTEHSWPQGQFDGLEPMKSDLHHIYPSDIRSNGLRSSYNFGMTSNVSSTTSFLGYNAGEGASQIFQVRPSMRGDLARAHFYMVIRYKNTLVEKNSFDDNKYAADGCINDPEEAVLRAWHLADPVDEAERNRNNRIEGYQGTRNPFIDRPDLVELISNF
jgi:deoxyribonuclease I